MYYFFSVSNLPVFCHGPSSLGLPVYPHFLSVFLFLHYFLSSSLLSLFLRFLSSLYSLLLICLFFFLSLLLFYLLSVNLYSLYLFFLCLVGFSGFISVSVLSGILLVAFLMSLFYLFGLPPSPLLSVSPTSLSVSLLGFLLNWVSCLSA